MLTDETVRDLQFSVEVFQSRFTCRMPSKAAMREYLDSRCEQESPWVYNKREDVNTVADILKQNMDVLPVGPAHVASYD